MNILSTVLFSFNTLLVVVFYKQCIQRILLGKKFVLKPYIFWTQDSQMVLIQTKYQIVLLTKHFQAIQCFLFVMKEISVIHLTSWNICK